MRGPDCQGPIQAHHLLRPWIGSKGMGKRADDRNVIPLCMKHHAELHTKFGSEASFFKHHNLPEDHGQKLASSIYESAQNLKIIE